LVHEGWFKPRTMSIFGMPCIDNTYRNQMRQIAFDLVSQAVSKDRLSKSLKADWDRAKMWDTLAEDLSSFSARDPALWQRYEIILRSQPFQALMLHRLAHTIISTEFAQLCQNKRSEIAFSLTQLNRIMNGVDIHPAASIGPGAVFDHIFGMVIGETVVIGKNCYLLGGVTLGARSIADNPRDVRRHPTIGDNVQIGAYARILGPITIGDDCFIAPHAVVTQNIPSKMRISIVNQLQVNKRFTGYNGHGLKIYGTRIAFDKLTVYSNAGKALNATFVDVNYRPVAGLECQLVECRAEKQVFRIKPRSKLSETGSKLLNLRLSLDSEEIYVVHPAGHWFA